MAVDLPDYAQEEFSRALASLSPEDLVSPAVGMLWAHYQELRRWSPRLSLVGPGTAGEVLERHYGEALWGLSVCPRVAAVHVDLGSGGGFPGFVLAAARPEWDTTLVEPRSRKWTFLESAARRAGLSLRVLNARVDTRLPPGFPPAVDVVTVRALKLPAAAWEAVVETLAVDGRVVWWQGAESVEVPAGLRIVEEVGLFESRTRKILVAVRE